MSNTFVAHGHLARDAELKHLPSGSAVLNFVVGNNTGYGDNQKTIWLNCAIFGKRAKGKLSEILLKGTHVLVNGELSIREYKKNDGSNGFSVELTVNQLDLLGSKNTVEQTPAANKAPAKKSNPTEANNGYPEDFDDDIPF
jgi:single-strand DNA-binding protein